MKSESFFKKWSYVLHWWLWTYKIQSVFNCVQQSSVHYKWTRLGNHNIGNHKSQIFDNPCNSHEATFQRGLQNFKSDLMGFYVFIKFFPTLNCQLMEVTPRQTHHVQDSVADTWLDVSSFFQPIYKDLL